MGFGDGTRSVRGSIIDEDEFVVGELLVPDRIQGFAQGCRSIVDRDDDRESRQDAVV